MTDDELRLKIAEFKGYVWREWEDPHNFKSVKALRKDFSYAAWYYPDSTIRFASDFPNWPTDIAAAWGLAEEAGFIVGPEFTGGFDSKRCGWCVYRDWIDASDDVNSYEGSARTLAVADTAPRAICEAWLAWKAAQ